MRLVWIFGLIVAALSAQEGGRRISRGTYHNVNGYAYRVEIPPGMVGWTDPAPAPVHGFRIDLEGGDSNYIWVDGSYNAVPWRLHEASESNDVWIAKEGEIKGKPVSRQTRLAGLPAEELTVQFTDRKSGRLMICRIVTALRPNPAPDGILYTIGLRTEVSRLPAQERIWRAVIDSFGLDSLR